jgi:hypothetical protein
MSGAVTNAGTGSGLTLEQLQREMAAAVMQPLTPDEQMQPVDTTGRWGGRAMEAVVSRFIQPNDRLTAFERLEIYNRQYWFRLQGAFAEDFAALRAVVGGERFEALANAYLAAHPSRSFTLRNLGARLHGWLESNPSFAGRRAALALDVVRVEWACVEAFDNAERAPLSAAAMLRLDGDSRLGLQPYVRLLDLAYPADDLVLAMHRRQRRESSEAGTRHEDDEAESGESLRLRRRRTWLAVHRLEYSLYYKPLTVYEFRILSALREGRPLGEALEAAFEGARVSAKRRLELVQSWFANWAELGWICAPDSASELNEKV